MHNASTTGLLLETASELAVGDPIDIDLPQAGVTSATVVWVSGSLHGCKFDEPLSAGTLSAAQLRSDTALGLEPDDGGPIGESFGAMLRRLRGERGLTLEQLGDSLGVSKPTVWAWEQGKSRPQDDRIDSLASELGVSADVLRNPRRGAGAAELVARSREQIAHAYNVDVGKVKIAIEL